MGVNLRGVETQLVFAIVIVAEAYREAGFDLTITSVCDGKHMEGSLHGKGLAVDFRTKTAGISQEEAEDIADTIRHALGPQFDVVVEADHIHLEFDPKDDA
jgi:hypothetical protein